MRWTVARIGIAVVGALLSTVHAGSQVAHGPRFDPSRAMIGDFAGASPRALTPMDLLTIRDPKGVSISPDGKYVAFVVGHAVHETNSYRSAMYVISTEPGATPRNLGSAGMPYWDDINQWIPEPPQWSADSRMFTYRMKRSDRETWQVWAWDLHSQTPKQLTHVPGDVENYEWCPDGLRIYLTVKKPIDPAEVVKLSEASVLYDGKFRAWESVPVVDAVLRASPVPEEHWIYDFTKHSERKAEDRETVFSPMARWYGRTEIPANANRDIAGGKISPDGKSVAFLQTIRDPQMSKTLVRRLLVERMGSDKPVELTPDASFIEKYWWSADGQIIYYTEMKGDGHSPRLMAGSIASGLSKPVFVGPASDYFTECSMNSTSTRIACLRERNTSPAEIALVDIPTGVVRTLVDLNPAFKGLTLSAATRMEGVNSLGDPWFAYLIKPLGYDPGKSYPLIVTTYRSGDFFLRGASGDESPVQVYAAHGFAVLCFDVGPRRNTTDGDFATRLLDWSSPTASIEMAVHQLVGSGLVDPSRVGITGFSHGEEIVGYAVTHTKVFRAVVGGAAYDPCFYYFGGNVWHTIFTRWGLGGWPEGKSKVNWQEISMSLRADHIDAAILENAADSEYIAYLPKVVPLEELGKAVELHIYPDERHVRNQPKHRYEIYVRNLNWFRFWLDVKADELPMDPEEIMRWNKLRQKADRVKTSTPLGSE